ncbi:MAG: glycosyltransferase [Verrucomicrobiae bacterium]|nr:glycosyltransferase [Verrucomicrobiae bacterium]
MNGDTPKISVCVPVYNGQAFLRPCLESVLNQTRRDFELVVLDNASRDASMEIIRSLMRDSGDPRLRLEQNAHTLSMGANWNRALSLARGDFVKILPCDDELAPDCLEKQAAVLENHPRVALVACARQLIGPDGGELHIRRTFRKKGIHPGRTFARRLLFSTLNLIGEPGAGLFRRRDLADLELFDPDLSYYVDVDFWLRILDRGDLYYFPEPLSRFRIHGASASASARHRVAGEYRRMFLKREKRPPGPLQNLRLLLLLNLRDFLYNHFIGKGRP